VRGRARERERASERESEIERMGKQYRQIDVDTDDEVFAKSRGFDCNISERCLHGCVLVRRAGMCANVYVCTCVSCV